MLPPPFPRLTAALALLCATSTSCSYDLAERPNAGLVADAVDNKAPAAATSLLDVRWELRELAGQPAPAMEETPHFVLHDGRARTEGRAGCNRFSGPYSAPAVGQLRLGPLATTRSACPDLATEATFLRALNQTQQYRISGTTLSLYSADTLGAPLARLQAVADK